MSKILIVDDDFAIRLLYQEELKEEGYTVKVTDNCRNFMRLIKAFDPDLVILDIMMGEFNGLDLLQQIRKDHYDLPVVLCSAYSHFKYDLRSIAADYYVIKSADLSELKHMIKLALENRYSDPDYCCAEFDKTPDFRSLISGFDVTPNHLKGVEAKQDPVE